MIDHGDHLRRAICDVCERPFSRNRIVPVPHICRDCRVDMNSPAYPVTYLDDGGEAVPP